MARWEPGTAERLQQAALELFASRGYEQTTATEIAQSVGLTERTFFRHFADKREVLFHGQELLQGAFLTGMDSAPAGAGALDVVIVAMHSAATEFFPAERRPHSRARQTIIDRNPALRERERHKLATLGATVAAALRDRGIGELPAVLAAESGIMVFRLAFGLWIREGEQRSLADIQTAVFGELFTLTATAAGSAADDVQQREVQR
ncbi:TetR/AcrR family transcriptional regulator [Nocardia sp. BMG111209]|uniref:TetR/AcrR family transcriptional regulator n=1 Tax=Nocardia sp. BMG111209 TaxID=1160137 RepID=UPI00039BA6E4|nr:TetR/AcrR family transcriptional regulator [Nocardia sp. BMG111209]